MLLKVGSKGDDVKKMQAKLGLADDGIFGTGTEKAVKAWQTENGLTADGIVGAATWSKLFADISTDTTATTTNTALDLSKLTSHVPDVVISQIPGCAKDFQINTPLRLAHFLAQCDHESGGFKVTQENLNYSVAGLKKTFSKYFPGNLADSYVGHPEKIASRVYARKELGNGDEASKDGYKYRGRGYIQLTGKDNYSKFDKSVDDDILNNPDLVSERYALLSAAWFWNSKSLNSLADKGSSDAVVTEITEKVNGGKNGLDERIKNFKKYYALLA